MINGKKILVVGAGNAGRPAANLLNYLGNQVRVSDMQDYNSLPKKARKKIKKLEEKGVVFELGTHIFDSVLWADAIFISPNIPPQADIRKFIEKTRKNKKIDLISTSHIGEILNSLIELPMVGIGGTDGKTTTTNMINHVLQGELETITFSSLQDSLVIEGLIELVVNEKTSKKELAVFELPHGTIRLADGLELCAGVVTNLTPDHMDEFKSYEDYINRNFSLSHLISPQGVLILNGDDPVVAQQGKKSNQKGIYYGLGIPQIINFEDKTYGPLRVDLNIYAEDIQLEGLDGSRFTLVSTALPTGVCENCGNINCSCGNFSRKIVGPFKTDINLKIPGSCNIENALAAVGTGLVLGFDLEYLKERIESFPGVKGRFEKIGQLNEVNIFMDAAHNPESMEKLLEGLSVPGRLIISLDNPDTLTIRDKSKIGGILDKKADVIISSAKNETTEVVDWKAVEEVISAAGAVESYGVEDVTTAILMALEISAPGDTILHLGPGVVNAYENVKNDIKKAIDYYQDYNPNVVVIGGCGTVGSLLARVLKHNGADVTVSDVSPDTNLKDVFTKEDIKMDLGGHSPEVLKKAQTIVLTPGLKDNQKLLDMINKTSSADIIGVDEVMAICTVDKPVIGITGTNGKTTTTWILKHILYKAGYHVPEHHMPIQGNTELIPALQARLKGDMAVVEIGTFGNPGEIKNSALNCEVDLGLITNISRDHLKEDDDFNLYVQCKKEMTEVADILILNADDPLVTGFAHSQNPENIIFYGIETIKTEINTFPEGRECPLCEALLKYEKHYLGHLGKYKCICGFKKPPLDVSGRQVTENSMVLRIKSEQAMIKLKIEGIYNIYNALSAAAGAWALGIKFEDIVAGLQDFTDVEGRFEKISDHPSLIIDYAHNPAGVKAVIQRILSKKHDDSRLIVVNTISSESGSQGDGDIAKILNYADVVIPASYAAYKSSKYINKKIVETRSSAENIKKGTLGASKNQVKEALEKALELVKDNDIILVIGEGGVKYSKKILGELGI
ncbi:MAG: hypothetical protein KKF16_07770 [Euryarchaeota archaeon]|nr:hypothetical protein [Euryarchaeota archaeon]MBU4607379.1 hypothetical protein [Euryarchaeota archaeon]MBV1729819.1 hypothetical protein [Methanobacterium sp.]MBV1754698.1 hypothetical protein [Methanobacterium sp.]